MFSFLFKKKKKTPSPSQPQSQTTSSIKNPASGGSNIKPGSQVPNPVQQPLNMRPQPFSDPIRQKQDQDNDVTNIF